MALVRAAFVGVFFASSTSDGDNEMLKPLSICVKSLATAPI